MKTQDFQKHWTLPYSILSNTSLDALLISTHAPGVSAYNQVERKMAPLSKALSGILFPYETFGTFRFVKKNYLHKPRNKQLDFQTTWECVFSSQCLPVPVPVRQIPEGPAVPSVSDVKARNCFVGLWKRIGI